MPDVIQNVIIEFISDTTKLAPAVDQLESIGKIEQGQAASFKATNAEINKQAAALKTVAAVGDQISATGRVTKKNLADLAAAVKGMSGTFQKEFQLGVIEQLKKAGVGTKEFTDLLSKSGIETQSLSEKLKALKERLSGAAKSSPFADLQKQISEAKNRVFDLAAQMERLKKTGGAGTSGFATLTKELKEQKAVLSSLEKEYHAVTQSAEGFGNASKSNEASTTSLRGQLRQMVEQLALLKVQGKDTSAEYLQLAADAGKLRDAIGDANKQVNAFASDTSNIDGLIGVVQGAAGAFAVVQGAAALFGDESEELQKTLLRVNAAMAVLQGLQQVSIILQKESAASKLLDTAATKGQAIALAAYNFIIGTSTGLTKAFRIALAATGIGLLVIGLYQLVTALQTTNNVLEDTNKFIDDQNKLLDDNRDALRRNNDERLATLEAAGELQSDILLAQEAANIREQNAIAKSTKTLIEQRKEIDKVIAFKKSMGASIGEEIKSWNALNEAIGKNNDELDKLQSDQRILQTKTSAAFREEQKKEADDRKAAAKQAADDAKKAREERLQKEKEARAAGFADFKASVELELLAVEKGSQEELDIKKRVLRAELQQALDNEKLTDNQRKLLIHKFFAERKQLEKDFGKDRNKIALENIASDIQAELQGIELSTEKKLELTETAILLQAAIEVQAANGVAEKITEINAKRDKAIRDARLASIEETLAFELSMNEVSNASHVRAIQRELDNEKTGLRERIGLINELTGINLDANFKRITALNKERADGLISQKDYNLKYKQLIDEQVKIVEDGEKKKTDSTESEGDKRLGRLKQDIGDVVKVASLVSDILSGINDIQSQKENEKIASERAHIKELQDAGAITEKDAIKRMKKIDAEERVIKQKQAQRDKAIALFNAIINTARGVAAAIPNPFLIALAVAVGAAQIAIIASKPIPKFAKGKKGSYEGLAEVGEAGSELIEKGGKMFVTKEPQIVWLGKTDKVYSHKETVAMMTKPLMNTERESVIVNNNNKNVELDAEKIGKAVGKYVQQTIVVDGVTQQVIKAKEFIKYLDGRRSF